MQEALRHAAALLGELRTSLLGPQKYYELYMQANDDLRSLEAYFSEEKGKGRSLADLYELVQHAGNVLPRLYLLCTVGACYIRSREAPAKAVLQDMVDMCKGVQHPTRGLFLRAYLVQQCRGLLPDTGSAYAGGAGGDVVDAIEFLLSNFTDMNKLWVRMKRQGSPRERDGRERERAQLSDLVGKNLTQISQLEGLTFPLYADVVLPRVLEQVVACKDELAQGYLMQCVAAAFPDDFHVGTLEALLGVLPQLQPGVKLAAVMGSLLERLAGYAAREAAVVGELDAAGAFPKMSAAVAKSVAEHPHMPAAELAAMYAGLLAFAGAVYPERVDYVDAVLETCHAVRSSFSCFVSVPFCGHSTSLACLLLSSHRPPPLSLFARIGAGAAGSAGRRACGATDYRLPFLSSGPVRGGYGAGAEALCAGDGAAAPGAAARRGAAAGRRHALLGGAGGAGGNSVWLSEAAGQP